MLCRSALGAILLVAAAPLPGRGQLPANRAAATRPQYQVLRFNESWPAIRDSVGGDAFDPIKHVPLAPGGSSYLSFGGQLRFRGESSRGFLLGGPGIRDDDFALSRLLLHGDLHVGTHLRAFVELKHATVAGRELPGGKRPLDEDVHDIQNAFIDLSAPLWSWRATARLGRQELLFGAERLLSPLDWTNTRRTFQGARAILTRGGIKAEAFAVNPVVIRQRERNRPDDDVNVWGASLERASASGPSRLQLYAIGLNENRVAPAVSQRRTTTGARIQQALPLGTVAQVEGAWQSGHVGADRLSAWFVATDLTRAFTQLPLRPSFSVGADVASGDNAPGDGVSGTFGQLYPLAHAYAGFMDVLGRQNLTELRAVMSLVLPPGVQLRVSAHDFARATRGDAIYGVSGGVLRPAAPNSSRAIGRELDITAGYRIGRHLRLDVGYGHFNPATVLRLSSAGAVPSDWAFASTSFTF
jgi:hypothetical protein